MRKIKKAVVFIFTIVMAFLMSVPTHADILSSSKVTTTIDAELQSLFKVTSADKRIPVDIWLYETSTVEEREQKVFSKIGINKAQITADTKGMLSSKQVDEYIMTERSMYATERAQQYASMRLEYSNVQGLQEKRQADTRLFYSQYAPMISAELTSAEIKLLAQDSRVQSISYSPHVTLQDEGDVSLPTIDADYTRDTLGYTGSGIKIGMIETNVPDKNAPYFISNKIHIEENLDEIVEDHYHANIVAAIMVGQSVTIDGITYEEGIVPDAQLYATRFHPEDTTDWRQRVEWLVSQGVHVINMSAGIPMFKEGQYTVQDRWLDHIAHDHYVHFVKASGNNTDKVSTPGMAYNIITVGAVDDMNSLDETDHVWRDFSNYVEVVSKVNEGTPIEREMYPTNKPDLVAPGAGIRTAAGEDSGTSFAAPHVAAVIAQFCEHIASFKVLQSVTKAVLTASVSHSSIAYDTGFEDLDNYDKCGAGVINAKAAFETINAYRMMTGHFPAKSDVNIGTTYTFSASVGQRVRVSLTWLKYAYLPDTVPHVFCEPSESDIVNLDLYIYDPDGVPVGNWCANNNNTEIADFVAAKAGTYTIVSCLRESPVNDVCFGIAWWLGPINNLSSSN